MTNYPCVIMCDKCNKPVSDDARDENSYYVIFKHNFKGFSQDGKKYRVCLFCLKEIKSHFPKRFKFVIQQLTPGFYQSFPCYACGNYSLYITNDAKLVCHNCIKEEEDNEEC